MAHPVHDLLRRFLGTEQFAFDAGARDIWPWERRARSAPGPDETEADDGPNQFDDVYPWLEPES